MYFWKTGELVKDLRNKSIDESQLKNYYLASAILTLVGYYLVLLVPPENTNALLFEAVGSLGATIFGVNLAFSANNGVDGLNFLDRAVSISFPLLVKVVAAGAGLGLLLGVVLPVDTPESEIEWLSSGAIIAIQVVFFWRLAIHIRRVNA